MAVLETQSCNERAIAFYKKCGFEIIGFDLYALYRYGPGTPRGKAGNGEKADTGMKGAKK